MAKKSLISAIALAGLALVGKVTAQDNSFYNRTSDFMLVTNYINNLDRNKDTSMDKLLRGGNVTSIYAMDAIEGLKGKIEFLNSERAKSFYSNEERELLIGRYNSFIAEIAKEPRSPNYLQSLEQLSKAASDGTVSSDELWGVEDGTYMLVKEGIDSKVGKYSVPALVKLERRVWERPSQEVSEVKPVVQDVKPAIVEPAKKEGKDDIENAIRKDMEKQPQPEVKPVVQDVKPAKEKTVLGKTDWSLTFGANSNVDFDNFGGSVGFRAYPNEGKVGLGLAADVDFGLDKTIKSYKDVLIDDLSAVGNAKRTNDFSIGLSGELQFGPVLIGAGAKYNSKITEKTVELLEGDEVIKSNSDSDLEKEIFGKVYGGFEIPLSKSFGIDALGGYDWKDGLFFGLKSNIKLNK
jgi:hypothetical protein